MRREGFWFLVIRESRPPFHLAKKTASPRDWVWRIRRDSVAEYGRKSLGTARKAASAQVMEFSIRIFPEYRLASCMRFPHLVTTISVPRRPSLRRRSLPHKMVYKIPTHFH